MAVLAEPALVPRPRREVRIVFGALMLAVLLAALDSTIVATALPTITADLGGLNQLSWVVTAYLLAFTIATPIYGKLGDLLGRKRVFQIAIAIFLIGSALCGLAHNMGELIVFRGLQGIGGGGLIVLAQAIVGDVVSPRERGRYQGLFGAVFGVSSVLGPLAGGFLVDNVSWRWIFYVNLPIGALALVVVALVLHIPQERREARIDWAGTALLGLGTGCIVLLSSLGGTTYDWSSPQIVALGIVGVLSLAAFVPVERRAAEPVLPLSLLADRTFAVAGSISFIVGVAMFGATTYLPLFLQVVNGASPTGSGLELLPLMLGLLTASIGSGQIITRWGRYKAFPIAGTAIMVGGFLLLSTMGPGTTALTRSLDMLVLGIGIGLVMQVLVLVVQNAVDYRNLGVATSGVVFFRSIGGCFGVAAFGAIFSNRLTTELTRLGAALPASAKSGHIPPSQLARLPAPIRDSFVTAYADALTTVFIVAAPVAALAFVLAWLLPERPLRTTVETSGVGEAFAMPREQSSLAEIDRALSTLTRRDSRRGIYEELARRAGVDLEPRSAWMLARVAEHAPVRPEELADCYGLDPARVGARVQELRDRGLLEVREDGTLVASAAGRALLDRLIAARRDRLAELLDGWAPEQHGELAVLLDRLASSSVADHPDADDGGHGAKPVAA
jgi:EmrB/QacA subfamily drug resistance transporter